MGKHFDQERLRQVGALLERGMSQLAVQNALGLSPGTMARYVQAYRMQVQAMADLKSVSNADRPPAPTTREKVEEVQKNIAGRCLSTAQRLVASLDNMTELEMRKIPASQRALAAGILVDKARLLTDQATENISLKNFSWVQMVTDTMPRRAKDGMPEDKPATPAALPEGVDPNEDFLK